MNCLLAGMEQAFLDDIVAHPDEPSLWLILADWLDEREDPRGELVRLTWALQYEPDHPDFKVREARVQALLAGGMIPVRPRRKVGEFEFAWIPSGSFFMGSPGKEKGRSDDEKRHRVTLTAGFWMGVYPVTQSQWLAVMGTNPSAFSRTGDPSQHLNAVSEADLARFPVDSPTWTASQQFCQALSERLGECVALLTEAQWEYACRAGTTTPFHFGSVLNGAQANINGTFPYGTRKHGPYLQRPTVVGSYPPNAWGLYDLHGNVWEWCADAYQANLEDLPSVDPFRPPGDGDPRAVRGGAARAHGYRCRAAARLGYAPTRGQDHVGLRVCLRPA